MRIRPTIAVPSGLALAIVALAGCSGGDSTTVNDPVIPTHPESVSTTAPPYGSHRDGPGSDGRVLRFDAPADVSCTGATTNVTFTYATVDLTAVAFVVDGQSAAGATPPPTSGEYSVAVPCDGNVHTIQLVGSGPSGPAFASKAVVTRST